jgi:hypothetical protein
MTRRRCSEQQIQRCIFEHLAWLAAPGVFAFHVPLGGFRRPVEAAILKSIGTVPGIPDLICIFEGHCFCLELKSANGRLTDVQRIAHERMREAGATVATAYGIDEAIAQLAEWRLLRPDVSTKPQKLFNSFAAMSRQGRGGRHSSPTTSKERLKNE